MVLRLKPMAKLITFDKYLSVRQNKGPVDPQTTVLEEIIYFKYLSE